MAGSVKKLAKQSSHLALALGYYVKRLCILNIARAIKNNDEDAERKGEKFLKLYSASWVQQPKFTLKPLAKTLKF